MYRWIIRKQSAKVHEIDANGRTYCQVENNGAATARALCEPSESVPAARQLCRACQSVKGAKPKEGGYVWCGPVPPWDESLGPYREFSDAEKADGAVCRRSP